MRLTRAGTSRYVTWIWALTAAALIAALPGAAPRGAAGAETARKGGTLTLSIKYSPSSIDPQKNKTITDELVASLMAEPLVDWANGAFVGFLAKSWDIAPDGKLYTFHLQRGVKFQDGAPLTAAAVKASFERMTDPTAPMPRGGNLANVARIEAVDDLTVRVSLKSPDPDFLGKVIQIYILDPNSWKGLAPDKAPSGTGPFQLVDYVPDQRVAFKKFAGYWGGDPYLDQVIVQVVPDPATQEIELESGKIDFMDYVPPKDAAHLQSGGMRMLPFGQVNWGRVVFNLKTVTDVRVRQAACYAFDRNEVLQSAFYGLGTAQLTLALPGTWAYTTKVTPYRFDPARAASILDTDGWTTARPGAVRQKDGKPLVLSLPTSSNPDWVLTSQMIQQMLRNVGIDTRITTMEPNTFYDAVRTGKYDVAWFETNASPVPPIAAQNLDSHQYWDVMQQQLPDLDALVEKASATVDRPARQALYLQIQQAHHDQALECTGIWLKQVYATTGKVRGMVVDPLGVPIAPARWWKAE